MKTNKDKYHLLASDTCYKAINVCGVEIKSSDYEKLIIVKIDSMLNFKEHLSNM